MKNTIKQKQPIITENDGMLSGIQDTVNIGEIQTYVSLAENIDGAFLEISSNHGASAIAALDVITKKDRTFTCVDIKTKDTLSSNLKNTDYTDRVSLIESQSTDYLNSIVKKMLRKFCYVYYDASREFEDTARDIEYMWACIAVGGYMVIPHYHPAQWIGHTKAVNEFIAEYCSDISVVSLGYVCVLKKIAHKRYDVRLPSQHTIIGSRNNPTIEEYVRTEGLVDVQYPDVLKDVRIISMDSIHNSEEGEYRIGDTFLIANDATKYMLIEDSSYGSIGWDYVSSCVKKSTLFNKNLMESCVLDHAKKRGYRKAPPNTLVLFPRIADKRTWYNRLNAEYIENYVVEHGISACVIATGLIYTGRHPKSSELIKDINSLMELYTSLLDIGLSCEFVSHSNPDEGLYYHATAEMYHHIGTSMFGYLAALLFSENKLVFDEFNTSQLLADQFSKQPNGVLKVYGGVGELSGTELEGYYAVLGIPLVAKSMHVRSVMVSL